MLPPHLPHLAAQLFGPSSGLAPRDALLGLLRHLQHHHPGVLLHTGAQAVVPAMFHPAATCDALLSLNGQPRVTVTLRALGRADAPLLDSLPPTYISDTKLPPFPRALVVLLSPALAALRPQVLDGPGLVNAYAIRHGLCPERASALTISPLLDAISAALTEPPRAALS